MVRVCCVGALVAGLSVARAGAEESGPAVFDLALDGAHAGLLTLDVADRGPDYNVAATMDLTATPGTDYVARAQGKVAEHRLVPQHYTATDPVRGDADVIFSGGAPYVAVDAPLAHPHWIANLSALKGALDPLAAFWSLARDVPVSDACVLRVFLYDGRHLAQVVMFVPEIVDGTVVCQGEYRRLAGFAPDEMVRKQRFAFFLTYGDAGSGMVRLQNAQFETLTGFGTLKRR
jgi:hypothetical protein